MKNLEWTHKKERWLTNCLVASVGIKLLTIVFSQHCIPSVYLDLKVRPFLAFILQIFTIKIIYSSPDEILALIAYYGGISCSLYSVLSITEIIILKVLFIFKFSTIAAVNEYFLKKMIVSFNIIAIGIHFITRITLNEHQTSPRGFAILRSQAASKLLNVRTEAQVNVAK